MEKIEPRLNRVTCSSRAGLHRLAYTEWGDPNSSRVALCVHGVTRQGRDFDALAVALVEEGYRVVCPDLAGRGQSEWLDDPEEYALPQYVNDMITLVARLNVEAVDYIGTSLGGIIGIQVASKARSPIRSLVVNDVGALLPWGPLFRIVGYLKQMPRTFPNFFAAEAYFREVLAPFGNLGDSEWYHLTKHSIRRGEDGRLNLLLDPNIARGFKAVPFYNVSMWREWDRIRCPVLLLRGMHSDLLSADVAAAMTKRGPKAKLIEFRDCGHAPALMDYRQVGAILSWLARQPGSETVQ